GGIGLYHYAFDIDGLPSGSHDNKFGADHGGGLEGLINLHTTVTAEVLSHAVQSPAVGPIGTFESRFWSLRAGVKHYFYVLSSQFSVLSSEFSVLRHRPR